MAAPRTPGGFGSKLRETRERKGITLRQIANATKTSTGVLEALERNDISRLPGGIFSRAFVRSYAIEVGLEPEETIREFLAQFPPASVTAGHPTSAPIDDSDAPGSGRRTTSAFLRLVAFSLPIAGAVLYFSTAGRSAPNGAAEPEERQFLEVRRELVLTAGDAGAISWTLNGASARPLGKSGAVVRTSVTLTNFKNYLAAQ